MKSRTEPTKDRVETLQADAAKMLDDLSNLTSKLKDAGKAKAQELGDDAVSQLTDQLQSLQSKLSNLTENSEELLSALDKNVRANPYMYIAGALGVGLLLGKALRS